MKSWIRIICFGLLCVFALGFVACTSKKADQSNSRTIYYDENDRPYIISNDFKTKTFLTFSDGLAMIDEYAVKDGVVLEGVDEYRYLDETGHVVLSPMVYRADYFSEGLAAVIPFEGGLWGYMNKGGQIVIEPKYISASMFHDGLASVCIYDENGQEQWLQIDTNGNVVQELDYPIQWESHTQAHP